MQSHRGGKRVCKLGSGWSLLSLTHVLVATLNRRTIMNQKQTIISQGVRELRSSYSVYQFRAVDRYHAMCIDLPLPLSKQIYRTPIYQDQSNMILFAHELQK